MPLPLLLGLQSLWPKQGPQLVLMGTGSHSHYLNRANLYNTGGNTNTGFLGNILSASGVSVVNLAPGLPDPTPIPLSTSTTATTPLTSMRSLSTPLSASSLSSFNVDNNSNNSPSLLSANANDLSPSATVTSFSSSSASTTVTRAVVSGKARRQLRRAAAAAAATFFSLPQLLKARAGAAHAASCGAQGVAAAAAAMALAPGVAQTRALDISIAVGAALSPTSLLASASTAALASLNSASNAAIANAGGAAGGGHGGGAAGGSAAATSGTAAAVVASGALAAAIFPNVTTVAPATPLLLGTLCFQHMSHLKSYILSN